MTVTQAKQPPFRVSWPLFLALLFGPVLVYFLYESTAGPTYAPQNTARYLTDTWRGTPDPMTRVRCDSNSCEVWLRPQDDQGSHGAYMALTMDTYLVSGALGAPGYTPIVHWTTHLVTRAGTLTAACTTTQAQQLSDGPSMTKAILERWCRTFWMPSGA